MRLPQVDTIRSSDAPKRLSARKIPFRAKSTHKVHVCGNLGKQWRQRWGHWWLRWRQADTVVKATTWCVWIWKGERKIKSFIASKRVCVCVFSVTHVFLLWLYTSKTGHRYLLLMMCGMDHLPDSKAPSCILSSNILTCTPARSVVLPAAWCPLIGIESKQPTIAINHRAGFWERL
jgi:hypothetical protein